MTKENLNIKNFDEFFKNDKQNEEVVSKTNEENQNNLDDQTQKIMNSEDFFNATILNNGSNNVDKSNNLETAKKESGISKSIDDMKKDVLNFLNDKGVKINTYKIADCCNLSVDNVANVLKELEDGGEILKTKLGDQDFWFSQKFE